MVFYVAIVIVLGCHEPHPCEGTNLIAECFMCSDCSTEHSPASSLLHRPPYSLKHINIEIKPMNNSTMACKCSSEWKSCMFFSLSQKLKMIKLSEKVILKAKIGQMLRHLVPNIYPTCKCKEKVREGN